MVGSEEPLSDFERVEAKAGPEVQFPHGVLAIMASTTKGSAAGVVRLPLEARGALARLVAADVRRVAWRGCTARAARLAAKERQIAVVPDTAAVGLDVDVLDAALALRFRPGGAGGLLGALDLIGAAEDFTVCGGTEDHFTPFRRIRVA